MAKVFGIGMPLGGCSLLEAVFEANGYRWRHWMAGRLAANVAYCRAIQGEPLKPWGQAVGFSGLYGPDKAHLPSIDGYRMFRFLHQNFPDAYFIHTHFEPADWVAARFMADDGAHRALCAGQLDCPVEALPAVWLSKQAKHSADCREYFDGNPRFLDFNVATGSLSDLCDHFRDEYELEPPEVVPDFTVSAIEVSRVLARLELAPDPPAPRPPDFGFCSQVAEHCAARRGPDGAGNGLSRTAVLWHASGRVTKKDGETAPLTQSGRAGEFLRDPVAGSFERAQSVLNQIQSHSVRPPVWVDMMDARFVGSLGRAAAPRKTIAYNRRENAKNVTLWPLPGYHSIAPTSTPGGYDADALSFDEKQDKCVWLGNLTGRMSEVLTPKGRAVRSVYAIRDEAEDLGLNDPWDAIIADLDCVPRYRFVKTYRDHPDFRTGLVLRGPWAALRLTPAFDGLWTPLQPSTWFHDYRYVVSLAGNDTGSNFLSAAASNSLIFKEEDGWELFYTSMFKPWVHYVPLKEGALDVESKLAWARANPEACKAIASASREVFDLFARPENLSEILSLIAQGVNEI